MALVVHCVFDANGLHLEQGMPWGCGTAEPKPRPTVATEVFCGFSSASMGCVQGLGSYLSPMGRLYLLSLCTQFCKAWRWLLPDSVAEIGHRHPEWVGWDKDVESEPT